MSNYEVGQKVYANFSRGGFGSIPQLREGVVLKVMKTQIKVDFGGSIVENFLIFSGRRVGGSYSSSSYLMSEEAYRELKPQVDAMIAARDLKSARLGLLGDMERAVQYGKLEEYAVFLQKLISLG